MNIWLVMLVVLCHAFREHNAKTREEKRRREVDMTGPVAWAKRQILAVKNTLVYRQNTPTMAQWSLFSANPNSQTFVKRNHHYTIQQIPSFLWEVFPKGLQSSTTNKLNWFSVMQDFPLCLFDEKLLFHQFRFDYKDKNMDSLQQRSNKKKMKGLICIYVFVYHAMTVLNNT